MEDRLSIVFDIGENVSECGYTKKSDGFHAYSLWAQEMTAQDYQDLIDRNWRRSGKHVYKPDPAKCAALQYTIRLDVSKFKPSKKQKNTFRRFLRFLQGLPTKIEPQKKKKTKSKSEVEKHLEQKITSIITSLIEQEKIPTKSKIILPNSSIVQVFKTKKKKFGDVYSPVGIRLSAFIHKEYKEKIPPLEISKMIVQSFQQDEKVKSVSVDQKTAMINFVLTDEAKLDLESKTSLMDVKMENSKELKKHKLEVKMVPAAFDEEAYKLYKKYQITIHKDPPEDVTEKGYKGFLIDSPLSVELTGKEQILNLSDEYEGLEGLASVTFAEFKGYGTFHVHYKLDGKLFMVAVIDVLPKCLSSVYVFYDPDCYSFISPGVVSALVEILYVKNLSKVLPNLKYYYMGYYIHNCVKMKYKGKFKPSELLCPVTYSWVPLSECLPIVEKDSSSSERVLQIAKDAKKEPPVDNVDDVLCIFMQNLLPFAFAKQMAPNLSKLEPKLKKYKQLVGKEVAERMAYVIHDY